MTHEFLHIFVHGRSVFFNCSDRGNVRYAFNTCLLQYFVKNFKLSFSIILVKIKQCVPVNAKFSTTSILYVNLAIF